MPKTDLLCPQCKKDKMDRKEWGRNPKGIYTDKIICPSCGFELYIRRDAEYLKLTQLFTLLNNVVEDIV